MEVAVKVPTEVWKRMTDGGWRVVDPVQITRDPTSYQLYLAASKAEFSVAKHGYVTTRCGWFSDRSSAYLASGRPVVVQETGFSDRIPAGEGILSFSTPEQARAQIEEVTGRYEFHCRAARAIAEEYFDARKVLSSLIEYATNDRQRRSASMESA